MFAGDYSIVSIVDGKISIDLDEKCWKILELNTHEETKRSVAILKEVISEIDCKENCQVIPCVTHIEQCFDFLTRVQVIDGNFQDFNCKYVSLVAGQPVLYLNCSLKRFRVTCTHSQTYGGEKQVWTKEPAISFLPLRNQFDFILK